MSVKPILFNTDMVRAILDGRKSCTRRIVKGFIPNDAKWGYTAFTPKGCISCRGTFADGYGEKFFKLPCELGDILYVRETWKRAPNGYYYYEDWQRDDISDITKWKPSIHMPKEAARIWLKVTSVRVDRLQDITEDGALKEGAQGVRCYHAAIGAYGCTDCMNTGWLEPPTLEFMGIWDSTIKKTELDRYGWNANPWVWVIEFERCEKPKEEN